MSACARPDQSAAPRHHKVARHAPPLNASVLLLEFAFPSESVSAAQNLDYHHEVDWYSNLSRTDIRRIKYTDPATVRISVPQLVLYCITVRLSIMLSMHQVRALITTCGRFMSASWHFYFSVVISIDL